MVSEFELIRRYFTHPAPGVALGVGDDAALLEVEPGMQLAASTDLLLCERHFSRDADPLKLGHKALAVNLSDLAAMGATPRWALLALALPQADKAWLQAFASGFMRLAREHSVALVGGDTTRGPLAICPTVLGEVPKGQALARSGAKPGDDIWVSGALGLAALGLAHRQHRIELDQKEAEICAAALDRPTPRIALGQRLRAIAGSAIDVSDGLSADLGHILERSSVGAVTALERLPLGSAVARRLDTTIGMNAALAGGDDYELCFTAPASRRSLIDDLSRELSLPLTRIGHIESGTGLAILDREGKRIEIEATGFDHFR
ncbi:MAG TPA: thiamine-phosphate kinase [Burkholderiales bacterium]|nr:thiamine-phosphate kinase [Burkholderiales bacterium]